MAMSVRKLALKLLHSYESEGRYVNLLLSSPEVSALCPRDKSFLTALLYGTVENKLKYDYMISSLSKRKIEDIDSVIRDILRLGLCQIYDMDRVPPHTAVNETVALAARAHERAFVNAVLREAQRRIDNPPLPSRERSLARYFSVFYSCPLPLIKLFMSLFGEETEKLILAFSEQPSLSLSVNTRRVSREALMARLSEFSPEKAKYTDGIVLRKPTSPTALPGFSDGDFFVQDEAARLAVSVLDLKPGMQVIDLCAAPGGKSFYAGDKVYPARVLSFDIHESKLSLIKDGAARLGLDNIEVAAADATALRLELTSSFDAVICDVPCSGLGVISKKPDLKYKSLDSLSELPALQYRILENAAKYLKSGGALVYSTCTLNPAENEGVTDKFISENPEFSYCSFEENGISAPTGKLTLLPHVHKTDGFYIAKIVKNS